MSPLAIAAYLTALLRQNDRFSERYARILADSDTPNGRLAAQGRLDGAKAHGEHLKARRAALVY